MKFHDTLNSLIWDLNTEDLIPEVKEKLEEIADTFIEFLEIPTDAVLDKVITGSSASYNYNEFSDLDLHIIVDYDKVHEDCPLVNGYLNSLKKQFNDNHDIFIHGVPVELYAEQKDQGTVHNGLYSLQTGWIDKPQKIAPTDNDAAVEAKYNEIKELVDKCDDSEEATELLDKIYTMRKAGLAEAGEFCTENLAFKKLRNEGCMDKLRQIKKEQIDKQLSLESYNEDNEAPKTLDYFINKLENRYPIDFEQRELGLYIFNSKQTALSWDDEFKLIKAMRRGWKDDNDTQKYYAEKSLKSTIKEANKIAKNLRKQAKEQKNKNESIKESLQSQYKQAFDLLVEGTNQICLEDSDTVKEIMKKFDKLKTIKSDKLKLKKAKDLLLDISGYMIDEKFDDYQKKIDKFMNNSKNESIKEEISDMTKQDIDNVMEVLRNDKKYYYDNHITSHVLYISAIKKRIAEFLDMEEREIGDILSSLGYPVSYNPYGTYNNFVADEKMTYEEFNKYIDNIPAMLDEDLTILEETLRKAEDMKKNIKEEQEKISLQDINNWFESKTLLGKQDDPGFYIRSAARKWPQLKGHEKELRDNLAKEKAKNHPWYPYIAMVTNTLAELGLFESNKNESIKEDMTTLEKKMDKAEQDIQDMISSLQDNVNESIYTKLDRVIKQALDENFGEDKQFLFTFKRIKPTELELTEEGGQKFIVGISEDDDVYEIKSALEDFVDEELAANMDDQDRITGSEVVGFHYNKEIQEGEFEANIFFNGEIE